MVLNGVTFLGRESADPVALEELPDALRGLLTRINGFVAFHGGLHMRGVCDLPAWHSIHAVWRGRHAIHRKLLHVHPEDLPFAEDFRGDQFLLRDGQVLKLSLRDGSLTPMGVDLPRFMAAARCDPVEFLELEPLRRFHAEGGVLRPGRILPDDDPIPRVLTPGRWRPTAPALQTLDERLQRLATRQLAAG